MSDQQPQKILSFGDFVLDCTDRLLYHDRIVVPLAPKALDTLVVLVENAGRLVAKDDLMKRVWADTFVEENNLNQAVSALRKGLGDGVFIETVPKRGYRFVAPVREDESSLAPRRAENTHPATSLRFPKPVEDVGAEARLEPVGGAIPLESRFYVFRPADDDLHEAVVRGDSIVLIKGARQMGKTSLLARGLQRARDLGSRVVFSDFQDLGASDLESPKAFFTALGRSIGEELDLDASIKTVWDDDDSPNTNFTRFFRKVVLKDDVPVVWGLDEVDRLFGSAYSNDVFGLFRAWHNKRALDPRGPWRKLTLAMAYATEAHMLITDVNQSPFNVGTRLSLGDFTLEQVADLNARYDSPIPSESDLARFHTLVGGQPFLTRQGLHVVAHGMGFPDFLACATRDDGPYGDHLRRLAGLLGHDEALLTALRCVLFERSAIDEHAFYRLRSAGILAGDPGVDVRLRCELYAQYFSARFA